MKPSLRNALNGGLLVFGILVGGVLFGAHTKNDFSSPELFPLRNLSSHEDSLPNMDWPGAPILTHLIDDVPVADRGQYVDERQVLVDPTLSYSFARDAWRHYYTTDLMPLNVKLDLEHFWKGYYARNSQISPKEARILGYKAMINYINSLMGTYSEIVQDLAKKPKISRTHFRELKKEYSEAFYAPELRGKDTSNAQASPYRISGYEKRLGRKIMLDAFPEPRDLVSSIEKKLSIRIEITD